MPLTTYRLQETTVPYDRRKPLKAPGDVAKLMQAEYETSVNDREVFYAIMLNTKSIPTAIVPISIGSLNATIVHPREIMKSAFEFSAATIILVHNHPTGDPTPSKEDIEFTRRMVKIGELVGIEILDHMIIGTNGSDKCRFNSMKESGYI